MASKRDDFENSAELVSAFDELSPHQQDENLRFDFFKRKFLLQAIEQLKRVLTLALDLNDLSALRESLYLISVLCQALIGLSRHQKENRAGLFAVMTPEMVNLL